MGVGSFVPGWLGDLDWQVAVLDLVDVGGLLCDCL